DCLAIISGYWRTEIGLQGKNICPYTVYKSTVLRIAVLSRIMKFSLSEMFTEDLAVDLGTVHTFIYGRGRGMVVNEPSLVAVDRITNEVIAVGNEALEMLGRSPEDVEVAYPMREGVVADSELAQKMLAKFLRKARGGRARLSRRLIMNVPSGITSVERFAINEVVKG